MSPKISLISRHATKAVGRSLKGRLQDLWHGIRRQFIQKPLPTRFTPPMPPPGLVTIVPVRPEQLLRLEGNVFPNIAFEPTILIGPEKQAEVFFDHHYYWVRNSGAQCGTRLNGKELKANRWYFLRDGDELCFSGDNNEKLKLSMDYSGRPTRDRDGVLYYLVQDPVGLDDGVNVPARRHDHPREVISVREDDAYVQQYLQHTADIAAGETTLEVAKRICKYTSSLFAIKGEDETTIVGWLGPWDRVRKEHAGKKFSVGYYVRGHSGCCVHRMILLALAYQSLGFEARIVRGTYKGRGHGWVEVKIGTNTYIADPGKGRFVEYAKAYLELGYEKDLQHNYVEVPISQHKASVGSSGTIYLK